MNVGPPIYKNQRKIQIKRMDVKIRQGIYKLKLICSIFKNQLILPIFEKTKALQYFEIQLQANYQNQLILQKYISILQQQFPYKLMFNSSNSESDLNFSLSNQSQYQNQSTQILPLCFASKDAEEEECLLSQISDDPLQGFDRQLEPEYETETRFRRKIINPHEQKPTQLKGKKQKNCQMNKLFMSCEDKQSIFQEYITGNHLSEKGEKIKFSLPKNMSPEIDIVQSCEEPHLDKKRTKRKERTIKDEIPKTMKRIEKQKDVYVNLNPVIKDLYFEKMQNFKEKINPFQLIYLIKLEKIRRHEDKILSLLSSMSEIFNEMQKQKKKFEQEVSKMDENNKRVEIRLKKISEVINHLQEYYCDSPVKKLQLSFSSSGIKREVEEKKAEIFDNVSFAKTFINSIEQLELRKVEEEEEANTPLEKSLLQLIYIWKKRVEGESSTKISEGLINRIASQNTLRKWIKTIDNELIPETMAMEIKVEQSVFQQYIEFMQSNQELFIEKIKDEENIISEFHRVQFSSWLTFIGLMIEQYKKLRGRNKKRVRQEKYEEIEMNMGHLTKVLKIISLKLGLSHSDSYERFVGEIKSMIRSLTECF